MNTEENKVQEQAAPPTEPAEETTSSVLKKAAEANAKWFVIHSQTGHEARVKTALEQRIQSLGMENKIFQVVIPTREIVVVKKGKKIQAKRTSISWIHSC